MALAFSSPSAASLRILARMPFPPFSFFDILTYIDTMRRIFSPKYFSSVVKQQTGHTASHWIQHYLVIQLKQALTYEPETSIQAIADRFGFSEQASFAHYFKKHTGVTPSEYREGK